MNNIQIQNLIIKTDNQQNPSSIASAIFEIDQFSKNTKIIFVKG